MDKVRLKDVCTLINGRAYKQEELLDDGKYPVLRVGNFFSDKDYYYSNLELENDKYCENGDLLFAWSASFGPKIWYGNKVIFHYHIWKIILSSRVYRDYLYYYLLFFTERIKAEGHGGVMIHVTKKEMEERELFLPTKERQIEISVILDKLKNIIKGYQRELCLLDNCVKARFVEMFGNPINNNKNWPTTELINVVKMQRGFDLPVQDRHTDGGIPVYGSNGILDFHDIAKIKGGGVITGRSGTIGNVYYTKGDYWPLNTTLFSADLHGNDIIYIAYLLQLYDLTRFVEGTGVPTLNRNMFHNKQVMNVPINEQIKFSSFVKQIDKSKVAVQKSLDETQLLFDKLMQEYFG